jgi:hypothetical protein
MRKCKLYNNFRVNFQRTTLEISFNQHFFAWNLKLFLCQLWNVCWTFMHLHNNQCVEVQGEPSDWFMGLVFPLGWIEDGALAFISNSFEPKPLEVSMAHFSTTGTYSI